MCVYKSIVQALGSCPSSDVAPPAVLPGPAAMVRPVRPWPYRFLREKNGVAWIPTYACVIEWPLRAVRRSFGRLRASNFFKSSSIQSIDDRIEASKFSMAILERETSARKLGRAVSCVAVISGSSVQSLL